MTTSEQHISNAVDSCTVVIESDDAPDELRQGADTARDALLNALLDVRTERKDQAA